MPTNQEQLDDIQNQIVKHKSAYPKLEVLRELKWDDAGCLSLFITGLLIIGLWYLIFGILFPSDDLFANLFVFIFYGSIVGVSFLSQYIQKAIIAFSHYQYKISAVVYDKEITVRQSLEEKERQIKKELGKEKEQAVIFQLNDLTYKLKNNLIIYEEASKIKEQLKRELDHITSIHGYDRYPRSYYDERFKDLDKVIDIHFQRQESSENIPEQNDIAISRTETESKKSYKTSQDSKSTFNETIEPNKIQDLPNTAQKNLNNEPSILKKVERKISNLLFYNKEKKKIMERSEKTRIPIKIDFVKLNEKRQNIGILGEKYAVQWEKNRLIQAGLSHLAEMVSHVSLVDDTAGYDILSFELDGTKKYIEVKTTTDVYNTPYFLSEREMQLVNSLSGYFLYRIYNFNLETEEGLVSTFNCKNGIENYNKIQPVTYKITPK